MLRDRERPLDHILHHCEFTVNFPMVFVILFTLLQQRSLHQLPKESIPHFERAFFFPKAHAPSRLEPSFLVTSCADRLYYISFGKPELTFEDMILLHLHGVFFQVLSPSLSQASRGQGLPLLFKKCSCLVRWREVSSALVFQQYLPEIKTSAPAMMLSSCISIFWAGRNPSSTEGRRRDCTPK